MPQFRTPPDQPGGADLVGNLPLGIQVAWLRYWPSIPVIQTHTSYGGLQVHAVGERICREDDRWCECCEIAGVYCHATKIDVEKFGLHGPSGHKAGFDTSAPGNSYIQRIGDRCGFGCGGEGVSENEAAFYTGKCRPPRDIDQPVVGSDSEARTRCNQPVGICRSIDRESCGRTAWICGPTRRAAAQVEIVDIGLQAVDHDARLHIVADLPATRNTGRLKAQEPGTRDCRHTCGSEVADGAKDGRSAGIECSPCATAVDPDIRTVPIIGRCDRRFGVYWRRPRRIRRHSRTYAKCN